MDIKDDQMRNTLRITEIRSFYTNLYEFIPTSLGYCHKKQTKFEIVKEVKKETSKMEMPANNNE